MMLTIDRSTRLHDIQLAFTNAFAYLKLEFLKGGAGSPSLKKIFRHPGEAALGTGVRDGIVEICIEKESKVYEVEKAFRAVGLPVQVFRKSGDHWIETSLTSDWTLDQQNKEAEIFSAVLNMAPRTQVGPL